MNNDQLTKNLRIFWWVTLSLYFLLLGRLAIVQFLQQDKYETQAKENRMRLVSIKAPRGEIVDRHGKTLAQNKLVYTVYISPTGVKNQELGIEHLVQLLNARYPEVTREYILDLIEKQKFKLFEPIALVRDIDWQTVTKIEESAYDLPGVTIGIEPLRYYSNLDLGGHILGYVHPIYSKEELVKYDENAYSIGDLIGKDGVEKVYEKWLKGRDGARRVEVDAYARPIRELVTLQPKAGNNVKLTIDADLQTVLQQSAARVLAGLQEGQSPKARVASSVVINVKTGAILALSSYPELNPNDFTGRMDAATAQYYFPDTRNQAGKSVYDPLQPGAATNRVLQATYPPGSTFKPIVGMAAMESGRMTPTADYVNCTGRYWMPPYIPCTGVHGNVNLNRAMAVSCNVYFQEMGRRAGKDGLIKVAAQFGLGSKTGIDLPFEKSGLLPTPEWKKDINSVLIDRRYENRRNEVDHKYELLLSNATDEESKTKLNKEKQKELRRLKAWYEIDYRFNTEWQPFDTYNMSIGQGNNSYTPLQLASYVATIANGGKRMQPYVVDSIISPEGQVLKLNEPKQVSQSTVDPQNIANIKRAMLEVGTTGTAAFLFSGFPKSIQVAAKTGTAQTGRAGDIKDRDFHGVFVAFAPYDDPEIAFAGVVEYGMHGGSSAGLICRDVFEQYFQVKNHLILPPTREDNVGLLTE
ncbi:MAG: penicillin-binding protein 2 [Methylocystaceae bacterium]